MEFLGLTDFFNNAFIIKVDQIVTIEEEMSETIVTLKTGRRVSVRESVVQVFELLNLRR